MTKKSRNGDDITLGTIQVDDVVEEINVFIGEFFDIYSTSVD